MVVGVGLRLPDSKPLERTDGVLPGAARPAVLKPSGAAITTDPAPRIILAQGTAPRSDVGALAAPQASAVSPQAQGLPLNLQNDLRRAYERMGADPATRDALVGRLAALPWGNALSFDRNDPEAVVRALPRIHDVLKTGFNVTSGDAPITLREVAAEGRANCFGSSQVFLGLADALGLPARSIQVTETTAGKGTLHVASMVDLPDGRQVTVDMLYGDAVSRPFRLGDTYRQDGTQLRVNPDQRGQHYAAIRPLSREQLRAFVDGQSPPRLPNTAPRGDQEASDLRYARAAIAADPNNPWSQVTLAEALERSRPGHFEDVTPPGDMPNLREQEAALRRAMELSPGFDDLYTRLGRIQDKLGDHSAALATRQQALAMFEGPFLTQLRSAAGMPSADLATLLAQPAATSGDLGYQVEQLIASRIDVGVSMGKSGDSAGAIAYLEETRRLATASTGTNWFEYYSGQYYIDQIKAR